MYFNKYNNFYHGIMFHHFHDGKKHLKGQGSIDQNDFYKLIKFVGKKNILSYKEVRDTYENFRARCITKKPKKQKGGIKDLKSKIKQSKSEV